MGGYYGVGVRRLVLGDEFSFPLGCDFFCLDIINDGFATGVQFPSVCLPLGISVFWRLHSTFGEFGVAQR